jgi:hypothetical protein
MPTSFARICHIYKLSCYFRIFSSTPPLWNFWVRHTRTRTKKTLYFITVNSPNSPLFGKSNLKITFFARFARIHKKTLHFTTVNSPNWPIFSESILKMTIFSALRAHSSQNTNDAKIFLPPLKMSMPPPSAPLLRKS